MSWRRCRRLDSVWRTKGNDWNSVIAISRQRLLLRPILRMWPQRKQSYCWPTLWDYLSTIARSLQQKKNLGVMCGCRINSWVRRRDWDSNDLCVQLENPSFPSMQKRVAWDWMKYFLYRLSNLISSIIGNRSSVVDPRLDSPLSVAWQIVTHRGTFIAVTSPKKFGVLHTKNPWAWWTERDWSCGLSYCCTPHRSQNAFG